MGTRQWPGVGGGSPRDFSVLLRPTQLSDCMTAGQNGLTCLLGAPSVSARLGLCELFRVTTIRGEAARGLHHVLLAWLAPCPAWLACLACSIQFNSSYPSRTPKLSQWSDRPRRVGLGPQLLLLSRGVLDGAGQCRWPALGIYSGVVACPAAGVPTRTAFCSQIAGEAIDHCMPLTRTTVEVFRPPLLLALWPEWHPANDQ